MKLSYLYKKKKFDDCKKLLNSARILAKIGSLSGFGELATLTGVRSYQMLKLSTIIYYLIYRFQGVQVLEQDDLSEGILTYWFYQNNH